MQNFVGKTEAETEKHAVAQNIGLKLIFLDTMDLYYSHFGTIKRQASNVFPSLIQVSSIGEIIEIHLEFFECDATEIF